MITCTRCHEEKDENQFQLKSLWKKMADGSIKRYPAKRAKQCHACVYWRDRASKRATPPKKRMWKRPDERLMGLKKRERELIQAMNPKLHPYAFKNPVYEFVK
jgi:hypothetical protein